MELWQHSKNSRLYAIDYSTLGDVLRHALLTSYSTNFQPMLFLNNTTTTTTTTTHWLLFLKPHNKRLLPNGYNLSFAYRLHSTSNSNKYPLVLDRLLSSLRQTQPSCRQT